MSIAWIAAELSLERRSLSVYLTGRQTFGHGGCDV